MERLDRIEAQLDNVRDEVRGIKLAQTISHKEQTDLLTAIHEKLERLDSQPPPPRRRLTALFAAIILAFGLGFAAHWRINDLEVRVEQPVLSPRGPLQNLQ